MDFCKKHDVKVVLSLFDIDLLVLAKNRRMFEDNGIRLILASAEFIEICNDKYKTLPVYKVAGTANSSYVPLGGGGEEGIECR